MTVSKGEIFALLGSNGTGKSTLINILTTYLKPTSGQTSVRALISCVAQKVSIDFVSAGIFLTTHYLEEADLLSDTVCIMKDGHKLVQDTPEHWRQHTQKNIIRIDLNNLKYKHNIKKCISDLPFVKGIRQEQSTVYIDAHNTKENFHTLNQLLIDKQIPFSSIGIVTPSLDDIFLSLTQGRGI